MPRNAGAAGTPLEWMRRAKSNLARAKQPKPAEALWEDLCFDAQQAAEKALKGVLVRHGIEFPKTHDIRDLLTLLDPHGRSIPEEVWAAVDLTDYAVASRYPGVSEPVERKEYQEALALAQAVLRWAQAAIKRKVI